MRYLTSKSPGAGGSIAKRKITERSCPRLVSRRTLVRNSAPSLDIPIEDFRGFYRFREVNSGRVFRLDYANFRIVTNQSLIGQTTIRYTESRTAQHRTAQHSTAQHSTGQHSTAQHSTAQHSTAQHSTVLHYGLHSRGIVVRFPAWAVDFPLHQNVQTSCGAHPAFYSMTNDGSLAGGEADGE